MIHPRRHLTAWLLAVVALAAAAALTYVDITRGFWDHDSGFFLLRGAYVASGLRPYLDYWSIYTPLMDLLHAIPIALHLDRLLLTIAIPFAWIVANSVASAALAFRLTGRSRGAAVAAALGYALFSIENGGNHVTLEHGVSLFALLAFFFAASPHAGRRSIFLAACSASAAALCKQNGAVAFLPVVALLWERRGEIRPRNAFFPFIVGGAAPLVAVLAWLEFDVRAIHESLLVNLANYASATRVPFVSLQKELARSSPTVFFFAVAIAAAAVLVVRGPHRFFAASLLAGGVVQFLPRLVRDYSHYDLNIWPFALAVVAVAAERRDTTFRALRLAAITLLGGTAIVLAANADRRWPPEGRLLSMWAPAADVVRQQTKEGSRVRQYGREPIIEFLADRLPDELDPPPAVYGVWDGRRGATDDPAAPGAAAVVIIDEGAKWIPAVRSRLGSAGFRVIFDEREWPQLRVTVYASPPESRRE